ncbi:MAG: hypothetical protein BWY63_01898 [Chloroflexi bacterium ADurb.Bin360]|nr:MAG: hypothetical protein BWY63_01898 [Chloroflexi bacterium ADurb.Bin360]
METSVEDTYIQCDNVAFMEHSRAGDAVYQFSIDRSTDGSRERMSRSRGIPQKRGHGSLFANPCFGKLVQFTSGHSWSQPLFQQRQDLCNHATSLSHELQFFTLL